MDESRDIILLVGLGVLVLVGTFATDLAGEIFDTVQTEVKEEEARRVADGLDPRTGLTPEETEVEEASKSTGLVVGPLNTTAVAEWLDANALVGVRAEADLVWEQLLAFNAYQWEPAARQAIAGRRRRLAGEEKAMPGADSENPIERLLASLATPAIDETAAPQTQSTPSTLDGTAAATPAATAADGPPSAATFFYGEDEATAADIAERKLRAEWSVDGGIGRIALTSLLFTFAMFSAAKEEWDAYPVDAGAFANATWAKQEDEAPTLVVEVDKYP